MKNTTLFKTLYASMLMALCITSANAQGVINTIAGSSLAGFHGDGGPAISASFWNPSGVATDVAGNIYVADRYNHRIRMIEASTGNISTVAGSSASMYSGMGGPALSAGMEYPNAIFVDHAGNYFITDYFADAAYEVSPSGISLGSTQINNICGCGRQGCTGDGGDGLMLPWNCQMASGLIIRETFLLPITATTGYAKLML